MKKVIFSLLFAGLVPLSASAQIFYDFAAPYNSYYGSGPAGAPVSGTGNYYTGVAGLGLLDTADSAPDWNQAASGPGNGHYTLGTPIVLNNTTDTAADAASIKVTGSDSGTYGGGSGFGPDKNFSSIYYVTQGAAGETFSLSGLADGLYTLYVYANGHPTNVTAGTASTANSTIDLTTTAGAGSSWVSGANVAEFTTLNVTDGTLTLNVVGSNPSEGDFNGFQLELAPEPSAYAMLGLGLVVVVGVARFRKLANQI